MILINKDIVALVLNLMNFHNFYGQLVAGVKKLLFLVMIGAHLYILIKKEGILLLVESPAQSVDVTTITAEAKYSINFKNQKIDLC